LSLAVACTAVPPSSPHTPDPPRPKAPPTVSVESGLVSAVEGEDAAVVVFKGIPFAAPPVGERRWLPPARPLAWQGVRSGAEFSKSCVQELRRSLLPWTPEYMLRNDVDEDCLALNVWAPAEAIGTTGAARPVLVYIHGGAFDSGSGEVLLYDGEGLAKRGIIVVTLNYRLGVFGFFCHAGLSAESSRHSSGNYGLLDQIAALEWVKRNIGAFGGDAENITVAGQSAGAASVHYLTFSPLARGLFQRAIAQSGAWDRRASVPERAEAEALGAAFATQLGAATVEELRAVPAARLLERYSEAGVRLRPIVDGWVVPDQLPALLARGEHADVPLLTGLTADERSFQKDYAHESLEQKQLLRDEGLATMLDWRRTRAQHGKAPSFGYLFERAIPWPEHPEYQAFHSSELPYVFDHLSKLDRPWEDVDRRLAQLTASYWVNFIRSGDPNGPGLPRWPASAEQVMRLGADSHASDPLP
jgi:para-nitrobenzyl esterase